MNTGLALSRAGTVLPIAASCEDQVQLNRSHDPNMLAKTKGWKAPPLPFLSRSSHSRGLIGPALPVLYPWGWLTHIPCHHGLLYYAAQARCSLYQLLQQARGMANTSVLMTPGPNLLISK